MRFLLIVKATEFTEAGIRYGRKYTDAVNAYKKTLARAGVLLAAEELHSSSSGIRILYPSHGGDPEITAGPFLVSQELIAGYTLIDVNSEDEATKWALQMPFPKGFGAFEIEMRKLKEETESVQDPITRAMEAELEDQTNI
ncbi:YciI family protein [Gracilibacillus kekensis]|uniref:Uncharacterized conserved protein n=1 Tax=Gracilibacillus kekensis TaxID=1027249 RepID=A0A1M7LKW8_9BACI|nr:YciI family protein [Gracilibacillus kekensis]SHM78781.1 Uncharacterized conserved protein [Gracilibacillus kekensis]